MQVKLFTIPALEDSAELEEMNKFLRSKRVLALESHFVLLNAEPCWSFCARYLEYHTGQKNESKRTDYKEVLDPETFARFSAYRELRKQIATEDGVPAYVVFTNDELAKIAELTPPVLKAITAINGVGETRALKYGPRFIEAYEKKGTPD
jgi:superfamily II DNA helicase RecQ